MMSAADWERMRVEMAQARSDRCVMVEFLRGDGSVVEQEVRVEAVGSGSRLQSEAAREARAAVVIFGASDLDVAIDDRFPLESVLFRVVFVAPNRELDTQAEAVGVE